MGVGGLSKTHALRQRADNPARTESATFGSRRRPAAGRGGHFPVKEEPLPVDVSSWRTWVSSRSGSSTFHSREAFRPVDQASRGCQLECGQRRARGAGQAARVTPGGRARAGEAAPGETPPRAMSRRPPGRVSGTRQPRARHLPQVQLGPGRDADLTSGPCGQHRRELGGQTKAPEAWRALQEAGRQRQDLRWLRHKSGCREPVDVRL